MTQVCRHRSAAEKCRKQLCWEVTERYFYQRADVQNLLQPKKLLTWCSGTMGATLVKM